MGLNNVLSRMSRPLMETVEWIDLNGLWKYAILPSGKAMPQVYDGDILVPLPVESALSRGRKELGEGGKLGCRYQHGFSVLLVGKGQRVFVAFCYNRWKTTVWINGIKLGEHCGEIHSFCIRHHGHFERKVIMRL